MGAEKDLLGAIQTDALRGEGGEAIAQRLWLGSVNSDKEHSGTTSANRLWVALGNLLNFSAL